MFPTPPSEPGTWQIFRLIWFNVLSAQFTKGLIPLRVTAGDDPIIAQLSAGIGRGCAVSSTGRLYGFTIPRMIKGDEDADAAVTEIHWASLRVRLETKV